MSLVRTSAAAFVLVAVAGCGGGRDAKKRLADSPCAPKGAVCAPVPSDCLAQHAEAGGEATTLRVAQLRLTKPAALARGPLRDPFAEAVAPNLPDECRVGGAGTFNMLLRFDRAVDKLTVGFAKPVDRPARGYGLIDETLGGAHVEPAVTRAPIQPDGRFAAASPIDLLVPLFLDPATGEVALLPVRGVHVSGQIGSDGLCIGRFNAEGLKPEDKCAITEAAPAFVDGGIVRGVVKLEEADAVLLPSAGHSLCVAIAGDVPKYGDGATPARCRREGGRIAFQGDWCSTTNAPATPACADAVQLAGSFAASAVRLAP